MKKLTILISILLVVAWLLTGCRAPVAADLMASVKAAEKPAYPAEPDRSYIDSVAQFSWRLLQKSVQGNSAGNVLVSPASVYLALAMTLNGADQATRAAMLQALSADQLSADVLNKISRDWMTLLMNTSQNTKLSIANSIWYRQGFNADLNFLQKNADYFSASAQALDFNNPAAPATINSWVKKATAGTIDKIIEKINDNVVMYLINAVYFKADWKTPFEAAKTAAGQFTAPNAAVTAKYMNRTGNMDYLSGSGGEGILLPYKDGRFAFVAILPDAGKQPRDLIASLSATQWSAMTQNRQSLSVALRLPKFETRFEDSLVDELKSLGMGVAFEPGQADFSLMNTARTKDLYISEVKHKTFCRVDELGTEAAAVTSVEVSLTALPSSDKQLNFDRPFIYGIIDTVSGLPLFIGIMENPA